jgi:hypothetical protein
MIVAAAWLRRLHAGIVNAMNLARWLFRTIRPAPAIALAAMTAAMLPGCGNGSNDPVDASAQPSSSPTTPPAAPAAPPAAQTVAEFLGLRAPKPATWIWHPPRNAMIQTNYTVPGIDGSKPADLNVYYFGEGLGGSVEANIERWKSQFRSPDGYEVEPLIDHIDVAGIPVTLVELEGEWMQMGMSWYTRDQLFLAAIVESSPGPLYIRLAGDARTVEANREAFLRMIHGLERADD